MTEDRKPIRASSQNLADKLRESARQAERDAEYTLRVYRRTAAERLRIISGKK